MDVKTRSDSEYIVLIPSTIQSNEKYCVIVWSKTLSKTVFKINFSNKVEKAFITLENLCVVLKSQINIYDLSNFQLDLKKENLPKIIDAKLMYIHDFPFLSYLEENSGKFISEHFTY